MSSGWAGLATGAATRSSLVFSGEGVPLARLGVSTASALRALEHALGAPTTALTSTSSLRRCGVTQLTAWHAFTVYFDHGHVVGESLGPGRQPSGATSLGLRLGDTLARARSLYPTSLRSSTAQGGTWSAASGSGRVRGYLAPSGPAPGPTSRIVTIDVGTVGCPATSP